MKRPLPNGQDIKAIVERLTRDGRITTGAQIQAPATPKQGPEYKRPGFRGRTPFDFTIPQNRIPKPKHKKKTGP